MTQKVAVSSVDRFTTPLYTVREAASYLGVPVSTFHSWVRGYSTRTDGGRRKARPVVTALRSAPGLPSVPFVGLAEGLVLAAIRRQSRVPLQRIRPAIDALKKEIGLEHALASRRLFTDGAEVLFDFAERKKDAPEGKAARELVVVRNNQRVFTEIVEDYLIRLRFGPDDYVDSLRLPAYEHAEVVADPGRSFGKPIFANGGARVRDALERFWTGDDLDEVAEEFGVPRPDLEDALRVASARVT